MAFRHHPAAAACYCRCCYAEYTPCHHHHPPPPPESHLHHPPHQPHPYSNPSPNLPSHHDRFRENYFREKRQTQPSVSSLLRRIAALEFALRRRASATSSSSQFLRDAAARTIQTHFRAFLLRRSITLRQLKDLASIKSTLGFLKSSVSEKAHLDYDVVYREAMNLVLKLDSIQGGDPMVRNGKLSLIRELNEFLDFIDNVRVKRRGLSSEVKSRVSYIDRKISNVKCRKSKRVNFEKLRGLVERIDKLTKELDEEEQDELIENPNNDSMVRIDNVFGNRSGGLVKQQHGGVQPKVKKNVSFAENGKVYNVLRRHSEPFVEEYCDGSITNRDSLVNNAKKELEDDLCREIEETGDDDEEEEVYVRNEGSLLGSDGEKYSQSYSTSEGKYVFCAPLPVKMDELII